MLSQGQVSREIVAKPRRIREEIKRDDRRYKQEVREWGFGAKRADIEERFLKYIKCFLISIKLSLNPTQGRKKEPKGCRMLIRHRVKSPNSMSCDISLFLGQRKGDKCLVSWDHLVLFWIRCSAGISPAPGTWLY